MNKKALNLLILLAVFMLPFDSSAITYWDNDTGNKRWEDAFNWSDNTGPTDYSAIDIGGESNQPVIADGILADETQQLWIGYQASSNGLLLIDGGDLICGQSLHIGVNGSGILKINSGSVTALAGAVYIGFEGQGKGILQLYGGIVNTGELFLGPQGQISITNGILIIDGNVTDVIADYVRRDLIRAYNCSGTVKVDYNSTNPGKTTVCAYPEPVKWTLVFDDGFYGTKLDPNKWQNPNWNGGPNRYADNVEVSNGLLKLKTVLRDKNGDGTAEWTMGTVSSRFFSRFGYYEALFRIGADSGLNNAFWLMTPQTGPDPHNPQPLSEQTDRIEIDIQECHYPDELNMNLHDWKPVHIGLGGKRINTAKQLWANFYKYGLQWDENDELFWSFEDQQVFQNSLLPADSCSFVETLFSTYVLDWAGPPGPNLDGTSMDIDWVRIYQPANNASCPYPKYNDILIDINTDLVWKPGYNWPAATDGHDIYFGTDYQKVLQANHSSNEFMTRQTSAIFDPCIMLPDTTYYWRIDEISDINDEGADLNNDNKVDFMDFALWANTPEKDYNKLLHFTNKWLLSGQICKGYVWEFTTALPCRLIDPNLIIAYASSQSTQWGDRRAVYAVNSAGLTGQAHSSGANGVVWMSTSSSLPQWFKVDLGQIYCLCRVKIWNFNMAGYTNRGCKEIDLYYSDLSDNPGNPVDNPENWIFFAGKTLAQAPGTSDYGTINNIRPDEFSLNFIGARWIAIKINSNYGGSYIGLSEIQFLISAF